MFTSIQKAENSPIPDMQHFCLDLVKLTNSKIVDEIRLDQSAKYKVVVQVASLPTKQTIGDYFPLNTMFFLEKPIHQMF